MPIPTGRTREDAQITIDAEACTGCSICATICKVGALDMKDGKAVPAKNPYFGCFGCGQCAALCPARAIAIEGRTLTPEDLLPLPDLTQKATPEQLSVLMETRRSVRDFTSQPVSEDVLQRIIDAASTAPMGIPPTDVELLVLDSKDKVARFGDDIIAASRKALPFLRASRPIAGLFSDSFERAVMKDFVVPLLKMLVQAHNQGVDYLFYGAPMGILFHGRTLDPADTTIAATYAMLAAEAEGLGSCMIGTVMPVLERAPKEIKERWGIDPRTRNGLMLIFGYPRFTYHNTIRRSFAKVNRP